MFLIIIRSLFIRLHNSIWFWNSPFHAPASSFSLYPIHILFLFFSHSIDCNWNWRKLKCIFFRCLKTNMCPFIDLGFVCRWKYSVYVCHISVAATTHRHRCIHCPFVCFIKHISVHCRTVLCLKQKKKYEKNRFKIWNVVWDVRPWFMSHASNEKGKSYRFFNGKPKK